MARPPVRLHCRTTKRPERGKMNQTETRFSELLEMCKLSRRNVLAYGRELGGEHVVPLLWQFEDYNLTLAANTQYRPDFFVLTDEGQGVFFEVKARRKDDKVLWEDDARVKFKLAAEKYWYYRFICASYNKTGWKFEEIIP